MGDSGKLRFYELGHESKIRLFKTHSHTSSGLAIEPGTRQEKQLKETQLKETQTLQQGKSHPAVYRRCGGGGGQQRLKNLPHTAGVTGRAEKVLRQTNHRKGAMARRALVYMELNTGANTREKSCEKLPSGHRHSGGLDEETTNTRDGRWQHLQPREGGKFLAEKTK